MDLIGPLPTTTAGKRFILVITDRFTKLARAAATSETTAAHVAALLLNNWIYPYGIPKSILTDNGPQFICDSFKFICSALGVRHLPITAYHAQSNGQTERYNQTLERRLRYYTDEN